MAAWSCGQGMSERIARWSLPAWTVTLLPCPPAEIAAGISPLFFRAATASLEWCSQIALAMGTAQARLRGMTLMALSNKFGHLVLSTGNKSELAVGYCTIYGDMAGGLAVISDVPKTMIYELARFINSEASRTGKREIIPASTIEKPPSAELRPNQKDQDTLPPYDVLDAILRLYVEDNLSAAEIIGQGFDEKTVRWVQRRVDLNEYKRAQAAPGLKVTSRAFGVGRRMPIAQRYVG